MYLPRTLPAVLALSVLASCSVGPDYVKPTADTGTNFKEMQGWRVAQPADAAARGDWWARYNDEQLNALIAQVDITNLTVIQYAARYRESTALADAARAAYFPTVSAGASITRERNGNGTGPAAATDVGGGHVFTAHSASVNLGWELDLWGKLRRTTEGQADLAQASAADLVNARLSAQASLASDYFLLRSLDAQRKLLDDTITAYERSYNLTQNQYRAGIVAKADVITAETQLRATQAQAIDVTVTRAQLEHAIAILLGKPPSEFTLAPSPLALDREITAPVAPVGLPSELLERRPDIAAAERRMASANAQIGVQKAAYYPDLTLSGALGFTSANLQQWFTAPSRFWSVGPAAALNLFNGGQTTALVANARATYDENVSLYRETVLGGLQQVEDNLVAIRTLEMEQVIQDDTVHLASQAVALALNRYKSGTASYSDVIVAQTTELSARKNQVVLLQRRLDATVQLVKAVGGGWDTGQLPAARSAS